MLWTACKSAAQRPRALAVGHFGCCNGNGVGQALRIDGNVALDPRYFLARIVAFRPRTIGILDALRVDDQKARRGLAPLSYTSLANHIFLKPAPGRSNRLDRARSTWRSRHVPFAISDIHWVTSATGSHFSASTTHRRTPRINQPFSAWFACVRFRARA